MFCIGSGGGGHEHSHEQENINVKAAFIHVIGDFIQSLGEHSFSNIKYLKMAL